MYGLMMMAQTIRNIFFGWAYTIVMYVVPFSLLIVLNSLVLSATVRQPRFFAANAVPPTRHVVIGTNEVDSDMAAALNLGPSFAITPRANNDL
ncbi:hypothetical protein TELCIR_10650 [Teladorsagia circumcincta]|uniref:Uncharacterized protein n=1 Tax=Teladorsagia circumcincta TaxID=45464 RepID=A0A2G9UBJ5_TELCI|nr:hypothetical protein TELCIR_10650 [Teladorsagia circumcincta]